MSAPNDAGSLLRLDFVSPPFGPHFTLSAAGIRLLLEAHSCARQLDSDVWEFAVELRCLMAAGLTRTQLRWLLSKGYLRQGAEQPRTKGRRAFRRCDTLSLSESACFVLTPAGAAFGLAFRSAEAEPVAVGANLELPIYDRSRRELRLGDLVVKRFRQPARNQELVLLAFEEEGWCPRIDDPLSPQPGQDPKRRLHFTIGNLNRGHDARAIHFEGGGDGQSVCWRRALELSEAGAKPEGW